ncbi:MAG: hypothetical protein J5755_05925, partial [Clostridia bacterium]|nr:hypothetical protein [Clostridia bacterium]
KLTRIHLDKYTEADWASLVLQNVYKLNVMQNGVWEKPSYREYLCQSSINRVFDAERRLVDESDKLAVLNMSMLLVLDYLGNANGFYDSLSKEMSSNNTDHN